MTAKRELISLEEWPSMAAPWSSVDEGEGWQWGDFLISIQKKPITLGEVFAKISGTNASIPMSYYYAAVVFYHPNSNPHGKSARPILSVGIEQAEEPDWSNEYDYMPDSANAQRAAYRFFQSEDGDELEQLGVVIVEGDCPDSSYYAAELRTPVTEANQIAKDLGVPYRFKVEA